MARDIRQTSQDAPLEVAVIGAGFAGMYMLHKLRGLGFDVQVFEAGAEVGGTWYWNRYPGARCDVESMQYSYSFDDGIQQDWTWSERFATQPEILRYARFVADRLDLRRDICFGVRITSGRFDNQRNLWVLDTSAGRPIHARKVVAAVGCLSSSNMPDIAGTADFAGSTLHTASWPEGGVDLTGKRVAVIGTGSSAIQAIPEIAKQAAQLTVFQRTPNFSVPARNQPLGPETVHWWKSQYPALRRKARETMRSGTIYDLPSRAALEVSPEDLRAEFEARWAKGGANFAYAFSDLILDERANALAADFVRDKIRETVADPATAEALCPRDYPIFCKRICVDTDYFATYNRPNVQLVDLRKTPISRITARGVQTSDQERAFDVIVYATGFDAITGSLIRLNLTGTDGRGLAEAWAEGPKAYLGLMTAGFPNLFMVTGPGSPSVLSNVIVSIEQHVEFIAGLLEHMRANGNSRVETDAQTDHDWAMHVIAVAKTTLYPTAASWYMGANIPGKPRVFMPYIGVDDYRKRCAAIAAAGYRGFRLDGVDRADLSATG
ncbi:NAD(P)/FAD-dependent oxidoreductase [Gemmobacter sp.]|uniref:flavin-containing monooxygenase n=1 Tax=Gemmobacter sp. TaxID=1898957 RepID=UPI002AFF44F7|nr:NAD(P)/FAD-dependent oxidoreductase [Gemmobacter sp.]